MCGVVQSGDESKSANDAWCWVIQSLCPVTWEESVNTGLCLWLFGWPPQNHGLWGCRWCAVFFLGKNLWMYCCPFLAIFADSSKRNLAFSRKRRLEPNLDLRGSSCGWWNRYLSLRNMSYCWAYRAATLMSYSDWTMWAFFRWCRAVLRYAYAWVVRSHISIITLLTHCRACAWLRSWVWERFTHNSIATCHSIERYPHRVSTLPITKSWTFTALQMSLFWISKLWGVKYIWKSSGCSWSRNFRKSPNIVATAQHSSKCSVFSNALQCGHFWSSFCQKEPSLPCRKPAIIKFCEHSFLLVFFLPNALENASQWMLS